MKISITSDFIKITHFFNPTHLFRYNKQFKPLSTNTRKYLETSCVLFWSDSEGNVKKISTSAFSQTEVNKYASSIIQMNTGDFIISLHHATTLLILKWTYQHMLRCCTWKTKVCVFVTSDIVLCMLKSVCSFCVVLSWN